MTRKCPNCGGTLFIEGICYMCNKAEKCPLLRAVGVGRGDSGASVNGRSREKDNWIKKLCFDLCPLQDKENPENDRCVYELERPLTAKEMDLFNDAIEKWREDNAVSSG